MEVLKILTSIKNEHIVGYEIQIHDVFKFDRAALYLVSGFQNYRLFHNACSSVNLLVSCHNLL